MNQTAVATKHLDEVMSQVDARLAGDRSTNLHADMVAPGRWVISSDSPGDQVKLELELLSAETAEHPEHAGLVAIEQFVGGEGAWQPADNRQLLKLDNLTESYVLGEAAHQLQDHAAESMLYDIENEQLTAQFQAETQDRRSFEGQFLVLEPEDLDFDSRRVKLTASCDPGETPGVERHDMTLTLERDQTWSMELETFEELNSSYPALSNGSALKPGQAPRFGTLEDAVRAGEEVAHAHEQLQAERINAGIKRQAQTAAEEIAQVKASDFARTEPARTGDHWKLTLVRMVDGAPAEPPVRFLASSEAAVRSLADKVLARCQKEGISLASAKAAVEAGVQQKGTAKDGVER